MRARLIDSAESLKLRCARDKIVSCNAEKSALTTSVCGATEYSKVFAGETTVAACCQAGEGPVGQLSRAAADWAAV